jgi:hypothetical protein
MPAVHKNDEASGLAVDLFDNGGNFIEMVVTSLYAALHSYLLYSRNMKWHDVERSMYRPTSCVTAVQ